MKILSVANDSSLDLKKQQIPRNIITKLIKHSAMWQLRKYLENRRFRRHISILFFWLNPELFSVALLLWPQSKRWKRVDVLVQVEDLLPWGVKVGTCHVIKSQSSCCISYVLARIFEQECLMLLFISKQKERVKLFRSFQLFTVCSTTQISMYFRVLYWIMLSV